VTKREITFPVQNKIKTKRVRKKKLPPKSKTEKQKPALPVPDIRFLRCFSPATPSLLAFIHARIIDEMVSWGVAEDSIVVIAPNF
jgi:hypothetical protein